MKRLFRLLAALALGIPQAALGAWTEQDGVAMVEQQTPRTWTETFTTTTGDGTTLDVRECASTPLVSFNASIGDTSANASIQTFSCSSMTDPTGLCDEIQRDEGPDGTIPREFSDVQMPIPGGFFRYVKRTGTTGGDTAQVQLQCLLSSLSESGPGGAGISDAGDLPYTPQTASDWLMCDPDPVMTGDYLDCIGTEIQEIGEYVPGDPTDWASVCDTIPVVTADYLDCIGDELLALEGGGEYVPSDPTDWAACDTVPVLTNDYLDCIGDEFAKNDELVIVTEGADPPVGPCATDGQPCIALEKTGTTLDGMWAGVNGGNFTLIGPGSAADVDETVDITGLPSDSICPTIQAALNPFLIAPSIRRVRIVGTGNVGFADLSFAKYHNVGVGPADGPFKICVGIQPSRGANGGVSAGYPISNASDINPHSTRDLLSIQWDLHLTYTGVGQNVPVVMFLSGGGFFDGPNTAIYDGVVQSGVIDLVFLSDVDGGSVRSAMPVMHTDTLFTDQQITVGFFNSSFLRGNESSLSKRVACNAGDADDLGFVHQHAWGTVYNSPRAVGCNYGFILFGASSITINEPYINGNAIGLAYGSDDAVGGDVVYFSDCVPGGALCNQLPYRVSGTKIRGGVIEGNSHHNVLAMDVDGAIIDGTQMEQAGATLGHVILVGAGVCSEDNTPCGNDGECSGTCDAVTTPQMIMSISNTAMPVTVSGAFAPLYIGEGAKAALGNNGFLMLDGNRFSQNTAAGAMVDGVSRFWTYDTSENLSQLAVHMSDNVATGVTTYPDYTGNAPDLHVEGTWFGQSVVSQVTDDFTLESCFRVPTASSADEVPCVSLLSTMTAPISTRWVLGRVAAFPAYAVNTDVACDIEAMIDTDWNGTYDVVQTNPVLYGSANCDLAPERCEAFAGMIWNPNGDALEDVLAFRASVPASTTRCVAGSACTCDEISARITFELLPDNR